MYDSDIILIVLNKKHLVKKILNRKTKPLSYIIIPSFCTIPVMRRPRMFKSAVIEAF